MQQFIQREANGSQEQEDRELAVATASILTEPDDPYRGFGRDVAQVNILNPRAPVSPWAHHRSFARTHMFIGY